MIVICEWWQGTSVTVRIQVGNTMNLAIPSMPLRFMTPYKSWPSKDIHDYYTNKYMQHLLFMMLILLHQSAKLFMMLILLHQSAKLFSS